MSTQPDTMREAFEVFAVQRGFSIGRDIFLSGAPYMSVWVAGAWESWQAATALATAAERERTKPRMAVLESLLKQASSHLMAWATKYGNNNPSWLPPAHDVRLLETIDDWLRSAETIRKGEALDVEQ